MTSLPPAGWYRDSTGSTRWWDGSTWGEYAAYAESGVSAPQPANPRPGRWKPWALAIAGVIGLAMVIAALSSTASPSKKAAAPAATTTIQSAPTTTAAVLSSDEPATSAPPVTIPTTRSAPPSTRPAAPSTHHTTTAAAPVVHATTHHAPPPFNYCGAPPNPWHYNFCGGSYITAPAGGVCDYFDCIANFGNGHGYMVECNDGAYSMSGGIRGACSYHDGERRPVYQP